MDREFENILAIHLDQNHYGPKVVGHTSRFRLEQFIQSSRSVLIDEAIQMLEVVALQIFNYHSITQKLIKQYQTHDDVDNQQQQMGNDDRHQQIVQQKLKQKHLQTILQHSMKQYLQQRIAQMALSEQVLQEVQNIIEHIYQDECIKQLQQILEEQPQKYLQLCHNDVHNFNFLFQEEQNRLFIIDYEFSGLNYISYEFANFFNEMTTDYSYSEFPHFKIDMDNYPDKQTRHRLLSEYLRIKKQTENSQYDIEQETEQLDQNILKVAVFSDLYWMMIGILSLDMKDPGIDMLEYVRQRYQLVKSKLN